MAFVYPSNFTGTRWRVIDGDIYVSYLGSDLSGTGSPTSPYRTLQHAVNVASTGSKIIVGTGNYNEVVDGLLKNCKFTADVTVLMRGVSGATAFSNIGSGGTIHGFSIAGYAVAVDGSISQLTACFIQSPLTNFGGTIKSSVLYNIAINGVGPIRFINCTLEGVVSTSPSAITRLDSCHFGNATNIQTSTPALTYFDFCNQQPTSTVQINAGTFTDHNQVNSSYPSFQVNGKSVLPQFNQPSTGDYTLAATSPIKNTGRRGTPIGALGEAVKMGVPEILSGGSLSSVSINGEGFMELPDEVFTGVIITPVVDLGSVRPVRTIHLHADQVFDETFFRIVSFNEDSSLPGAITVEMKYADSESDIVAAVYKPMIWDMSPTHDKSFSGNGTITFNVRDSTFITTRYVQFRITLRDAQEFILLAQENNYLLLQEDERQILV